jgi:hypothetical protein
MKKALFLLVIGAFVSGVAAYAASANMAAPVATAAR